LSRNNKEVLNPRAEPWTNLSKAEPRGTCLAGRQVKPQLLVRRSGTRPRAAIAGSSGGARRIKYKYVSNSLLLISCALLIILGCRPDEEILDDSYQGGLVFSTDTLLFDTLFASVGSTTKRIKVFNNNRNAVNIRDIRLGGLQNSQFTLTVNGITQKQIADQLLLGKDSLLIFVEVLIDPRDEDLPYLVKDSIVFETNGILQDIKLIAWGQDAVFLGNEVLPCNTVWTSAKPYVIYSSILIDSLCELKVEAGTQVFSTFDSYIYVQGSMSVTGTASERVIFRNDRLEPIYENAPGQWGGIIFLEGSKNNRINFASIRNAQYGLRVGTPDADTIPDIIVTNTIIENMSRSGILNFTSDVYVANTLVNNCKEFTVGNIGGGNYQYDHCTFANYGYSFFRETASFAVTDNIPLEDNTTIVEPIDIAVLNTIIHGNLPDEIVFNFNGGTESLIAFQNSLLQTTIPELDTFNNLLNLDPRFVNPLNYNYRLDTLSPAKDSGLDLGILTDLDSLERDSIPDIGAYERIE
jgi:hypothetical protein